ncbi:P-loop containing nucleoside triphosphate hydrolase protein [Cokeromyces recurvatus]|uniref:P-loop containing nucleoside triphosphate hydrolase protein n=1 Tax=Cokeromyces recurvatus TaxID=90255 RepID=UPI00221F9F1F|nr:P-loop containing nucleoside triphosphate hydrolase protein [Cokeromyces recurvatus]KAI7908098.1 P-loop containing nucleoside triphosphate hydrolase protein [Cokeromyces recurvatus]
MVDHSKTKDFMKVLQEAEPGKYLYQLRCSLPESFYSDIIHNTTSYRIKDFIPDFLYIHRDKDSKIRKVFIIDAKSSSKISGTHQFQVTSYALFLSYLIKDIRDLEIDNWGGVWLPNDLDKPEKFHIDFALSKIKYIYMEMLVNISTISEPTWVLSKKCEGCPFLSRCESEAKGTIRSIPYLNKEMITDKPTDIEDLGKLMGNLKIDNTGTTSKMQKSQYEEYMNAYQDERPRFLGYPSVLIAKDLDHSIYIYMQNDLYLQKPFVYGIEVLDSSGKTVTNAYFSVGHSDYFKDSIMAISQLSTHFVSNLTRILDYMDENKSRCLFYVYSEKEKVIIKSFLHDLVKSQGKDLVHLNEEERNQIVHNATRCLITLFRDIQLLKLSDMVHFPELDDLLTTSYVPRFVSIESLLQQNIALGISNYYRLSDVTKWMYDISSIFSEKSNYDNVSSFLGADPKYIYYEWKREHKPCRVKKMVKLRFVMLLGVMNTFWSLANEYMSDTHTNLFPLPCKPFSWPTVQTYNNPIFAKLAFFKQLECMKDCDQIRMDRIRDLSTLKYDQHPNNSRNLGGLVLEFRSQHPIDQYKSNLIFSITELLNGPQTQQKLDCLIKDNFCQYILVPDTREGIIQAINFSDMLYMGANLPYCRVPVKVVNIREVTNDTITLCGKSIRDGIIRWRLYRRYVNYTTIQTINNLKRMDNSEIENITGLINNPNSWAVKNVQDEIDFSNNKLASNLLNEFCMSTSQKDISISALKKRLQIVWGPPGSGKTEFLALFTNWYIKCLTEENKDRSLMIGVTAFTNDAILNLLKRIEKIQKRHELQDLFSIICVNSSKITDLSSKIIYTAWKDSITVKNKLQKTTPIKVYIIGATVWGWGKIRDKWKRFEKLDMLIIDESSQLLVSDALLAISCLKQPSGKLIIAGDHLQLGPIVKNNYSEVDTCLQEPLLYGSIQQCLMRTEDNYAIPAREFLLQKNALHEFGPSTLQLKENWRMNKKLNEFFQHIYGSEYKSRYPENDIQFNWTLVMNTTKKLELIKSILDPCHPISLVKVKCDNKDEDDTVETEAKIVQQLLEIYLKIYNRDSSHSNQKDDDETNVMIVTPLHKQRVAIQRRVNLLPQANNISIDTVEKMQGKECNLLIACFSCVNKKFKNYEFLRDFRRWNVALSRAR